jgi:hypothetical protein
VTVGAGNPAARLRRTSAARSEIDVKKLKKIDGAKLGKLELSLETLATVTGGDTLPYNSQIICPSHRCSTPYGTCIGPTTSYVPPPPVGP